MKPTMDQLLRAYRQAKGPDQIRAERVWRRVLAAREAAPPAAPRRAAAGWSITAAAAVVLLGGLGLAALKGRAMWRADGADAQAMEHANAEDRGASREAREIARDRAVRGVAVSESSGALVSEPTTPSPEPLPPASAAPTPPASAEPGPRPERSPAPRSRPSRGSPPSGSKPSGLREEMHLLARGQQALRRGEPETALSVFERHARRYPDSSLAAERELKIGAALCALGRTADALRRAAAFDREHPDAALTPRIRRRCSER